MPVNPTGHPSASCDYQWYSTGSGSGIDEAYKSPSMDGERERSESWVGLGHRLAFLRRNIPPFWCLWSLLLPLLLSLACSCAYMHRTALPFRLPINFTNGLWYASPFRSPLLPLLRCFFASCSSASISPHSCLLFEQIILITALSAVSMMAA